jgi:hypothetical protein
MPIKSVFYILSCCSLVSTIALASNIAYADPVLVCGFPQSPTKILDQQVTDAIFRQLNRPYILVDLKNEIGDHATSEYTVAKLLKSKCDVFMGVPISPYDLQFKDGMSVSLSYMNATFVKFSVPTTDFKKGGRGVVAVAYKKSCPAYRC